jgi:hypothetical protein
MSTFASDLPNGVHTYEYESGIDEDGVPRHQKEELANVPSSRPDVGNLSGKCQEIVIELQNLCKLGVLFAGCEKRGVLTNKAALAT